jgi:hypothetical protein
LRRGRPGERSAWGDVAADRGGDAAAVWIEPASGHDLLRISLRRPGHRFGTATTLVGSGYVSELHVAYGEGGDLVVAFARSIRVGTRLQRRVAVRVKRSGHDFGRLQLLGPSDGLADGSTAAARDGGAIVAWGTQDAGKEARTNVASIGLQTVEATLVRSFWSIPGPTPHHAAMTRSLASAVRLSI